MQDNWVQKAIAEYKEGASDIEVCDVLGISKSTFDQQYANNSTFRELVDLGRLASTAFWYRTGRKNLTNRQFNTTLWAFNMKNRYGWAEKSESTSTTTPVEQKSLDELKSEVLKRLPGILKKGGFHLKDADVLQLPVAFREADEQA